MTLFITALLGTPAGKPADIHENLWFLSDFAFAHTLLAPQTPKMNQFWLAEIDVFDELNKVKTNFPTSSHTLLHGSCLSERLELNDRQPFYQICPARLKANFLFSRQKQAAEAKAKDHLVILLFSHGDKDQDHCGKIECGAKRDGRSQWLERTNIEKALGSTQARVSVITIACFAAHWVSPHWALFAAAQTKHSLGIPASGSDRLWGSTFWTAMPELAANAPGCTFHPDLLHPQADSFEPPLDVPGGWHGILGFESTIDIVLRSNDLPRRPANPPVTPELDEEPASLPTGSKTEQAEDDDEDDSDDDSEDSEYSSDGEFEGAEEVDLVELERLLDHWETKTRPFNLYIAARGSLFRAVRRHRTGTASPDETQRLFRQFKRRAAADALAQRVAEEAGIALQLRCENFREVDGLADYCEICFMLVSWGKLSPHDSVDRMRQPYKKAGQWLFRCWSESGKGKSVLEDLLDKIGGQLYKFTENGVVPID